MTPKYISSFLIAPLRIDKYFHWNSHGTLEFNISLNLIIFLIAKHIINSTFLTLINDSDIKHDGHPKFPP